MHVAAGRLRGFWPRQVPYLIVRKVLMEVKVQVNQYYIGTKRTFAQAGIRTRTQKVKRGMHSRNVLR